MTTQTQPDALQLADIVEQSEGWTAYKAAAELRRQHARILELEAAQAQRVMRPRDCQRPECMSRGCFGHCMNDITQEPRQ